MAPKAIPIIWFLRIAFRLIDKNFCLIHLYVLGIELEYIDPGL